jgi:hypothetical protein
MKLLAIGKEATMKATTVLTVTAAVLSATLVYQLSRTSHARTEISVAAIPAFTPQSLKDTLGLADRVVLAKVISVRQEKKKVMVPVCEAKEVEVPYEVCCIQILQQYKGQGEEITCVQDHGSKYLGSPADTWDTLACEEGDVEVLFMRPSTFQMEGKEVRGWLPVSPEGRYHVREGGILEPDVPADRPANFANQYRGKPLEVLVRDIKSAG